MLHSKNTLMLLMALFVLSLAIIFFILHQIIQFQFPFHSMTFFSNGEFSQWLIYMFLATPIVSFIISCILFFAKHEKWLPLFIMLTMTFSSISLIASGNGLVEYHFSIFMVIAMLTYYEQLKLIITSTIIFAAQHFVLFFTYPILLCGSEQYGFSLLLVHAIFLIFTSFAACLQIHSKHKHVQQLQKHNQEHTTLLNNLLNNLSSTSSKIYESIHQLNKELGHSHSSSEQILSITPSIIENTQLQSKQSQHTQEKLHDLNEQTANLQKSAYELSNLSSQSLEASAEGKRLMDVTFQQMEVIVTMMNHVHDSITILSERMKQIYGSISEINSIAEKTNVLALNAAIEATRAGKFGAGFSIVAVEIRNLSSQSKETTMKISQLIHEIEKDVNSSQQRITKGLSEIHTGYHASSEATEMFQHLQQNSQHIATHLLSLSSFVRNTEFQLQQFITFLIHSTQSTEETEQFSKKIEGATNQFSNSLQSIEQTTENLQLLAHNLDHLTTQLTTKKFK